MKLSIVIPVFNEEDTLEKVVDNLLSIPFPFAVEIVIVDDCSTDRSWKIAEDLKKRRTTTDLHILKAERNGGKGAALRMGFAKASGEMITVQDADFEYDPADLIRLCEPIIEGSTDVVYGSRFSRNSHQVHRTFHFLGNRCLTFFSNVMSGIYLSDMETCYKVLRADLLKPLRLTSQRFGFEPEITAKIAKLNVRIREFPISYHARTYFQGKKITWRDGIAALWHIIRYNLEPLDPETLRNLPERYRSTSGRSLIWAFLPKTFRGS